MTRTNYVARAKRGAAFLDKRLGPGWRRKIRRTELDMAKDHYVRGETCGCVLAQLDTKPTRPEGWYANLADDFDLDDGRAMQYGFLTEGYELADWDKLTEAWRTVLREGA